MLFTTTLDEIVAEDHPIRYVDAILNELEWSEWERKYDGYRGQPPIHPKYIAGAILYGLMKRIRSSRDLEEATRERLDFQWFLERRTIDHSTFAKFRKRFGEELKELSKSISRKVVEGYETTSLLQLLIDGTRMRANSDRNGAKTAGYLEKLVSACTQALEEKLEEFLQADKREEKGEDEQLQQLRQRITELEFERERLQLALLEARRRDDKKQKIRGAGSDPVRVPVTDRDATILPNKEGGYAPNYTPTVAVEGVSGAIVDAQVVEGNDENSSVMAAVERCEEVLGKTPEHVVADGGFADGKNLEKMEQEGIETYIPAGGDKRETNPVNRPEPSEPVAEGLWEKLPRSGKYLDNRAFIYSKEEDVYYCPMGRRLEYKRSGRHTRTGYEYRAYTCPSGGDCPLAAQCIKGKEEYRSVLRDQYQDVRDRVDIRMAGRQGQEIYGRRAPTVEGVFGQIKQGFGIRQFLLRGIKNVRIEWTWICTAFNLKKLIGLMQERKTSALAA